MNRRFVNIFFIPGAAGNFICRCLNLLTGFYVFEPKDGSRMPVTTKEKFDLLQYNDVVNWPDAHRSLDFNWINFEMRFVSYEAVRGHCDFPLGGVGVRMFHPTPTSLKLNQFDKFIGKDDENFVFYIDPVGVWDWMLVHADIKDSHQCANYFKYGRNLANNPDVSKISLQKIVSGQESFLEEFDKICKTIKHQATKEELDAVLNLYKQWKTTTLDNETVKLKKANMIDLINRWYKEIMNDLNGPR